MADIEIKINKIFMQTQETLKRTPLYKEHAALNARMIDFGGWEMPVQYEGILSEYEDTRRRVAIFDTSHMGEFLVEGNYALSGLDALITASLKDMPLKTCRYGMILNECGGVKDDLIVYRIGEEKWLIVVNGATQDKDAQHFLSHLTSQASFMNRSFDLGKLDVQGPQSREVLKKYVKDLGRLEYYTFDEFTFLGEKVIISRTGYTGELGYEIYFPWSRIVELWRELLKNPQIKPAGLGVRDVLRIEMGYSLYGHELDETINPLEAGLKKFIDLEKDFLGKPAILREIQKKDPRKIVAFLSDNRRTPRSLYKIYSPDQEEIGVVTSGTFSPYLKKGIGLGFVPSSSAHPGQRIFWGEEENKFGGEITPRPVYKNGTLKN